MLFRSKVTLQRPSVRPRPTAGGSSGGARRGGGVQATSYGRESSAVAKFGTRLVAAQGADANGGALRPASRRANTTPTSRRAPTGQGQSQSEDGHTVRATVTRERPAWDTSTRATAAAAGQKRQRNISQGSAALTRTATNNSAMNSTGTVVAHSNAKLPSPAPSEDSGVGMYRNLLAQNPSLGRIPT